MKLLSLSVENFGTLHAFTLNCGAGLNTFCRENGAGKTTLAAFLCAMLYGLPNTRRSDIDSNDRKKYLPWQGGPFGGSITFTVHGKIYRAERYFADGKSEKHDTFVLYDLADNSVSHDYSEAIGYELFGLDAAAFMRSACLPQKVLSGDDGYESITER
ncbi:MAG: AAA family ATPase, partial [Clostridia bacterium]|nr:AAA family ATPase [Clostridia bacterium]